ncbi:MFS transporter [Acidisoma cellulosilytica]|uniref:MFS transporter n=1 Tax=Acidisoma cellulosilyticum TaxID=2802395 RepID=A0A963Z5N6_9PROT|nr:MFS transporter [Acidisoma cellulosilyticum]MCB8883294.1 MFS transporter [Acidisoma cellulosilyticum]
MRKTASGGDRVTDAASPRSSWTGLRVFNFFAAATQTGYGPFLPVFLTQSGWSQGQIGLALSTGAIASTVSQLPGGLLVDQIHQRRFLCAVSLGVLGLGALLLAFWPGITPVFGVLVLHGMATAILAPSIAAITLNLGGRDRFGEHVGNNSRYASLGNALTAAILGLIAYHLSVRAVFLFAAFMTVPAVLSLALIHPLTAAPKVVAPHPAMLHPKHRQSRLWQVFFELHMHTFAICVTLFTLGNAAMLPLALNHLAANHDTGDIALATTGSVIALQCVVVLFAPRLGKAAERFGRRPLLMIAFAALPIRALLLTTGPDAVPLIAIELLDGLAAAIMGVMIPLIAADLTQRTGYLNLAIGAFGLAGSLGATFSTTIAGWIADKAGLDWAFMALALPGMLGLLIILAALPETRPGRQGVGPAVPAE